MKTQKTNIQLIISLLSLLELGASQVSAQQNALNLDGSNDYALAPHSASFNFTTELTMEAWVKLPNPGANQKIIGKTLDNASGFILGVAGGGVYPEIWNGVNNAFVMGCITPNEWTHLAVTFKSGGNMVGYINGVQVNSVPVGINPITPNISGLAVGVVPADIGIFTFPTNGSIDEVAVWKMARTQAQIQVDMMGSINPSPSLMAYYNFNQGVAGGSNPLETTLTDQSGNANHGTLANLALSGTSSNWVDGFSVPPLTSITSFDPTIGLAGTPITITGTNFSTTPANNSVRFNGILAVVTASTSTSITTSVPVGAVTGPITVRIGSGCAVSSAADFAIPLCFPGIGQSASSVLGQLDFTSTTTGIGPSKFGAVGIAVHYSSGKIFVVDATNHRVLRFSSAAASTTGGAAEAVFGQPDFSTTTPGLSATKFNLPFAAVVDQNSGALWVTDANNNRVLRFDNAVNGSSNPSANGVLGQSDFTSNIVPIVSATSQPFAWGIALDANGDLWVASRGWNRILKYPNAASLPNGAAATVVIGQDTFSTTGSGLSPTQLNRPNNIGIDPSGNLWVADELNNRVLKFASAATLTNGAAATTVLGKPNFFSGGFVEIGPDKLYGPIGLHADLLGNLWVGDWANLRAVRFDNAAALPNGANASVVLGAPDFFVRVGGTTANLTGTVPGIAVDARGHVFVIDDQNRRILRFAPPLPSATNTSVCSGTSAVLTATGATDGHNYRWYDTPAGGTPLSSTSSFTTPAITSPTTFYVSLQSSVCNYEGDRASVSVSVDPLPPPPSTSGGLECSPSSVTVSASGATAGQYRWYTSINGGVAIPLETSGTFVTPVLSSSTTYYVSVSDGVCESNRAAVLAGVRSCTPQIATVSLNALAGGQASLNLPPLVTTVAGPLNINSIQLVVPPLSGASVSIVGGEIKVNYAAIRFAGTDRFTVRACDDLGYCAEQEFTIEVAGEITVFNAVSPNGDNKNEEFLIQYIDVLPETKENKVTIFDRWGSVVFEATNYNNTTVAFRGCDNNGTELPPGTYYYSIEFNSGEAKRTGFISLRR